MGAVEATGKTTERRDFRYWFRPFALGFAAILGVSVFSSAHAVAAEPFVMGTDVEETKLYGKWYRRVYGEAFRRMGVPLTVALVPTARLTTMADQGEVHGQPSRILAYVNAHPNQVRVEEALHQVRLALFAFGAAANPDQPGRLEDLAAGRWQVEYRRGVDICEQTLKPVLPAGRLSDVTSVEQGLKKLRAGRTDLYCDFDAAVRNELLGPTFKAETGYRMALDLGVGFPLYPYMHKSRAGLAPRLAETLRKMKAEGLIERYFRDAERELEAAR